MKKLRNSGLYINLFHGRDYPQEELNDWGFDGPILGPFSDIHITYKELIRLFVDDDWEFEVEYVEDLFYYDGKYYGDWSIITKPDIKIPEIKSRMQKPDAEKFKSIIPESTDFHSDVVDVGSIDR